MRSSTARRATRRAVFFQLLPVQGQTKGAGTDVTGVDPVSPAVGMTPPAIPAARAGAVGLEVGLLDAGRTRAGADPAARVQAFVELAVVHFP